jgi:hypothetical protein
MHLEQNGMSIAKCFLEALLKNTTLKYLVRACASFYSMSS